MFEENYSQPDNEDFFKLVDAYSADRNDLQLQQLVEKLYDFSRSHPWPNEWLDDVAQADELAAKRDAFSIPWVQSLRKTIQEELTMNLSLLRQAEQLIMSPGGPKKYHEAVSSDKGTIASFTTCCKRLGPIVFRLSNAGISIIEANYKKR